MSRTELLLLVPFAPGAPAAPSEAAAAAAGSLWGNAIWVMAAVACFALLGAVFMFFKYKSNGNNEGMERAGWVIGGCILSGAILGIVGTVTGT